MKAKKTQKKKYRRKVKGSNVHLQEILGILVFAFGILMMLSLYTNDLIGAFGIFMREISFGLFGIASFLIPPAILIYAMFMIVVSDKTHLKNKPLYAFLLFLFVSALIQAGHYKPEDFNGLSPLLVLKQFYNDGVAISGGGVMGGLVSFPLLLTFQVLGTIILLTALSLVDIILLTNHSISGFVKNIHMMVSKRKTDKAGPRQKRSKNPESTGKTLTGIEGEVQNYDKKPKVIDFRIRRAAEKSKDMGPAKKENDETLEEYRIGPEAEGLSKPLELVIGDFEKKKTPLERIDCEPRQSKPELHEIVVREAGSKNRPISKYVYPPYDLLTQDPGQGSNARSYRSKVLEGAKKLEDTLGSFGVSAKVINVTRGPTITRYELQPSVGVKVSRIVNLSDDIALNLAAPGIRIEAPIPGKAAVGIEVPNKETNMVCIREVIESQEFLQNPSKVAFAIGKDVSGDTIIIDIAKMPHLLIAGATGSGKSVCINSLIVSLLYKAAPAEVKLLLIDPKVVELSVYNGIPHLLIPVVTDPKKAAGALNWAVQEMVNRYKSFADKGVRDISSYNSMMVRTGEEELLPQIVIIIDELSDLMMAAPGDTEDAICRLAQMARAAGMHLVIATQRPSVDVITGIIKANIPSRISFAVSSQIDSRTILDMAGAEKLLGKGDMLLHPVGRAKPLRVQGANITVAEVERVVDFIKMREKASYDDDIIEEIDNSSDPEYARELEKDELLSKAIEMVVETGQASVSLIQRKFKVGYARAARIVDQMEERGVVGGFEGSKPRQILITRQQWQEMKMIDGK